MSAPTAADVVETQCPPCARQCGTVISPFYAYRFDLATGCPVGNACAPLATYPTAVTSTGEVVITLGDR